MISPTSGRVLLKLLPKTQGTQTFYVSTKDTNNQLQEVAEVIAVGPMFITPSGVPVDQPCQPGDHVVFTSWTFNNFTYNGENLNLSKFEDITGVIKE